MENEELGNKMVVPETCDFLEELQGAATLNKDIEIQYFDQEGVHQTAYGQVLGVFTAEGIEFAKLEDNTFLRLDQIISINGKKEIGKQDHDSPINESDFAPNFYGDEQPFVLELNHHYKLLVDRTRNRLYLNVINGWNHLDDVTELDGHFRLTAEFLSEGFTLLIDLSELQPDPVGVLVVPPLPARNILMETGLHKVAELIPGDCNTVVHGKYNFSVNSIRLRQFKDRFFAVGWLEEE